MAFKPKAAGKPAAKPAAKKAPPFMGKAPAKEGMMKKAAMPAFKRGGAVKKGC